MAKKEENEELWSAIVDANVMLVATFVGLVALVLWLAYKGVL